MILFSRCCCCYYLEIHFFSLSVLLFQQYVYFIDLLTINLILYYANIAFVFVISGNGRWTSNSFPLSCLLLYLNRSLLLFGVFNNCVHCSYDITEIYNFYNINAIKLMIHLQLNFHYTCCTELLM